MLAYVDQSLESLFPSQLLGGEIKLVMGTDVYQQPSVTVSDDMQNKLSGLNEKLNKYRSSTVTYTLGNETQVVDTSTIESWLQISSDSISVDQDAVKTYVQDLATKYNTIYRCV